MITSNLLFFWMFFLGKQTSWQGKIAKIKLPCDHHTIRNLKQSKWTFLFCYLSPQPWHMGVSMLGVQLELLCLAYVTATGRQDLRCVLPTTAHGKDFSLTPEWGQRLNPYLHGYQQEFFFAVSQWELPWIIFCT